MTVQEFEKLDKLWQLLEVALDDLDRAVQDPGIRINMGKGWHLYDATDQACYICLAGAVMHSSFKEPLHSLVLPVYYSPQVACRLEALDFLRLGRVGHACRRVYTWQQLDRLPVNPNALDVPVARYGTHPDRWRQDMDALLLHLLDKDF